MARICAGRWIKAIPETGNCQRKCTLSFWRRRRSWKILGAKYVEHSQHYQRNQRNRQQQGRWHRHEASPLPEAHLDTRQAEPSKVGLRRERRRKCILAGLNALREKLYIHVDYIMTLTSLQETLHWNPNQTDL